MPLTLGDLLPDVRAVRVTGAGEPIPLRGLAAAGPALLFVFKGDCPASPLGAAVLPRFAAVPGLAVAAVSQDGAGEARAFAAASGWDREAAVQLLLDPDPWPASDALGVLSTPTWILVAPCGRVERIASGWSRDDANALAACAAALAGVPAPIVAVATDAGPAYRPG